MADMRLAAVAEVFRRLRDANPHPTTELEYASPFQLLVAVVLSAQSTDKGVNIATRRLFALAPTPEAMMDLGEAGIALHWQMNDLPPLPWLDAQNALHVLRILQEVLTNIVKHSGAQEILLSTTEANSPHDQSVPGVEVRVQDNGRPFSPPETLAPGRRGLGNVRSRARALGAYEAWTPVEHGTVFTLWLPLNRSSSAPGAF